MDKYQAKLSVEYHGMLSVVFLLLATMIFVTVFFLVYNRKIQDNKERIVTVITFTILVLMLSFVSVFSFISSLNIKKDIDNNLFVTYYGEYETVYERTFSVCYIYDGDERIELRCVDNPRSYGVNTGYVVYSKNSLYAVDIHK